MLIGVVGGFMVGLTSVGAGSLILVLLVMVYPTLSNKQLVGTDLTQSLPLTFSATLGTLLFSHVELGLTSSIVIGSVPAVIVGSLLSSRSNGYLLRRIITGVVLLSGLKYVGVPTDWLGIIGGLEIVLITFLTFVTGDGRDANSLRSQYPNRSRVSSRFCQPGSTETFSSRKHPSGS